MLRRTSIVIAAGMAAMSFLSAGANATDTAFPLSVVDVGPVIAQHAAAPAVSVGRTGDNAIVRDVRSGPYEVQTPSSVNESAPWLTGSIKR